LPGEFLEANASARARMAQLVTISGNQRGDNQYEHGQSDFIRNYVPAQRNQQVARQQHRQRRDTQPQAIDNGIADREQRTESEKLHQTGIVAPEAGKQCLCGCSSHRCAVDSAVCRHIACQ
jgi:hypothetical protein